MLCDNHGATMDHLISAASQVARLLRLPICKLRSSQEGRIKPILLTAVVMLAFANSGPAAIAAPIDFLFSGTLVTYTVPVTSTYQILAIGAQGGGIGGLGASISGDFSLTAGEILQIAVGGTGGSSTGGSGGGGGSFVVGPGSTPLVIAGGGGGGGSGFFATIPATPSPGGSGLASTEGAGAFGNFGTNGNGGGAGGGHGEGGGGGGGFFSAGASPVPTSFSGGAAFPDLAGGSSEAGSAEAAAGTAAAVEVGAISAASGAVAASVGAAAAVALSTPAPIRS